MQPALQSAAGRNAADMYGKQAGIYNDASIANMNSNAEMWGTAAGAAGTYSGSKYGYKGKGDYFDSANWGTEPTGKAA